MRLIYFIEHCVFDYYFIVLTFCCRDEICPKRKVEDTNSLGVEASTFSSNSSSCSGGGPGDGDSVDFGIRKSVVDAVLSSPLVASKESTNGIHTQECVPLNYVKESLSFPMRLKIVTNEGGWCWITGPGYDASYPGNGDTDLLNNPMKAALVSLEGMNR